ncbi:MAG TPA: hypothetical protein VGI70_04005, partial [Polyangiales bacterium]
LVPTNVSHPSIAPLPPLDKSANEGPTASKRALLADWDDHLATAPARSSSAPAGHIDERDFR